MNRNIRQYLLAATALLSLVACGVKDPIFDTSHPGHGMVTLTTDWSRIGEGLTAPESYTVAATLNGSAAPDYTATLTGVTNRLDHLFAPGTYRFLLHNTAEHITVSGTTATLADVPGTADAPGRFVHSAPGWLFSSTADLAIAQDAEHTLTATMQQQVRQLTLVIEPTGGTPQRVESIVGTLSGVAGSYDMESGTHDSPASVALEFRPIADGADAGKWTATVRLLGTAGKVQKLTARLRFADDSPRPVDFDSDLSAELATFNAEKHRPLKLGGKMVETPTEAGFGATITDWTPVTGSGTAD